MLLYDMREGSIVPHADTFFWRQLVTLSLGFATIICLVCLGFFASRVLVVRAKALRAGTVIALRYLFLSVATLAAAVTVREAVGISLTSPSFVIGMCAWLVFILADQIRVYRKRSD